MANRTDIRATSGDTDLSLTHQQTDSPILPVAQLERLKEIAPERVEWVFEQTQIEAEHRRTSSVRIAWFTFAERFGGLLVVVGLCVGAIYVAYLLARAGHEWPAVAIGCTAPVGLLGAFFSRKK